MKVRVIGTGSSVCRHPLTTGSLLVQSGASNIVIGCGPAIPSKLGSISVALKDVSMWICLSPEISQIGGLIEAARSPELRGTRPLLIGPAALLDRIRIAYSVLEGRSLDEAFDIKAVLKIGVEEDHFKETLVFHREHGFSAQHPKYCLSFEEASVFVTGPGRVPQDYFTDRLKQYRAFLVNTEETHGSIADAGLRALPMYVQVRLWTYGYDSNIGTNPEDLPIMRLPQGSCLFDSERKEPLLEKERFLREASGRTLGNQANGELRLRES